MIKEPDSQDLYDENVPDASELLDFELIAKSQPEKGHGLWLWVVLVMVLAGGGWAGWMYMQDQGADEMANAGNVPMILAPQFDLKEKPADPGGMKIPDRDKLVYDRMAGDQKSGGANQVERLLPPPETPIEPPKDMPRVLEPEPAPEPTSMKAPESAAIEAVPTPPAAPPAATRAAMNAPGPAQAVAPAPKAPAPKVVATKVAPTAPAPVTSAPSAIKATGKPGQGFLIQLSAVRAEANAKSEWARLAKKHSDVLGGLKLVIQRADLGAKGIFFRVRGGWFANRNEAKAACAELARRNVGCLIAKP